MTSKFIYFSLFIGIGYEHMLCPGSPRSPSTHFCLRTYLSQMISKKSALSDIIQSDVQWNLLQAVLSPFNISSRTKYMMPSPLHPYLSYRIQIHTKLTRQENKASVKEPKCVHINLEGFARNVLASLLPHLLATNCSSLVLPGRRLEP